MNRSYFLDTFNIFKNSLHSGSNILDIIKMEERQSSKRSSQAVNKKYPDKAIEERGLRFQKRRSECALMQKRKIETETQEIKNSRRKRKDLQRHRGAK